MTYTAARPLTALALLMTLALGCSASPNTPTGPIHQRPPDSVLDPTGYAELAPQHVDAIFAEQQAGFRNCNDAKPGPYVSGTARLQFLLDARGRVEEVFVTESDIGSRAVEDCLVRTARFLEFPLPPESGPARFVRAFPFNEAAHRVARPVPESWGYTQVRAEREAIRTCRRTYGYEGPFHLTAYIGGRGRVLSAGFHARQQTRDDFADCVLAVIREIRFPDAGSGVVKYRLLIELLPDD
ncbi:MAG: hypothetical protein R3F65_18195 [bacterium]